MATFLRTVKTWSDGYC